MSCLSLLWAVYKETAAVSVANSNSLDPRDKKDDRKGGRYDEHSCRKVDKMMVGAVRLCRRNMPAVGEHLTECPAVS